MVSQKPKYCKNFERNSHWRKLSMIILWERYCNASPKPEIFLFSLFIFTVISQLIWVRLGWNFHRWFSMHAKTSKLMYNWSFLSVVLHKPTLLPSTVNYWLDCGRLARSDTKTPTIVAMVTKALSNFLWHAIRDMILKRSVSCAFLSGQKCFLDVLDIYVVFSSNVTPQDTIMMFQLVINDCLKKIKIKISPSLIADNISRNTNSNFLRETIIGRVKSYC